MSEWYVYYGRPRMMKTPDEAGSLTLARFPNEKAAKEFSKEAHAKGEFAEAGELKDEPGRKIIRQNVSAWFSE